MFIKAVQCERWSWGFGRKVYLGFHLLKRRLVIVSKVKKSREGRKGGGYFVSILPVFLLALGLLQLRRRIWACRTSGPL